MILEIERKYTINPTKFFLQHPRAFEKRIVVTQGYISKSKESVVRIRLESGDCPPRAILCIKFRISDDVREEYEYDIPLEDGHRLLDHTQCIVKERVALPNGWVVDQFRSQLCGLYLAEIEVETEEQLSSLILPDWVVEDVTSNSQYNNANLVGKKYENGQIVDI